MTHTPAGLCSKPGLTQYRTVVPRSRCLVQVVEATVQAYYLARYPFTTLRQPHGNVSSGFDQTKPVRHRNDTSLNPRREPNTPKQDSADIEAKGSEKSIPSRCLKSLATSLVFALAMSPCSCGVFQVCTHFAEITFRPFRCSADRTVPVFAIPSSSFPIAWRQIPAYSLAHASA